MSYIDDWRWPTEQKYLDDEVDWDIRERWEYLKQYEKKPVFSDAASSKIEMEHSVKYAKYKHQLEILTEQEKPQSTEQEEKSLHHWEGLLSLHNSKTGGLTLKTQLQQNEEKRAAREQQYLREIQRAKEQWEIAQEGFDRAKATIEGRLQQHEANHLKTETYLVNNVKRAKETLEGIRTFKSKPRIKLEMEMKPHKDYLEAANKDREERDEWQALKAKVLPEMKVWLKEQRDAYWKEKDEQERDRQYREIVRKRKEEVALLPEAEKEAHYKKHPEDRPYVPTPRPVKQVKKAAKQTAEEQHTAICKEVLYSIIEQAMALGTLSESNGPEGYSSVAASPCATRGRLGQDPQ